MSYTVDQVFTSQYEAEVKEAYQRSRKLKGLVREKMITNAKDLRFPVTGVGVAGTKARHGLVPTMNVSHQDILLTLTDYYAGDWVDDLDQLKTNIDERMVLSNAAAWALGRKADDLDIQAMSAVSGNSTTLVTTSSFTARNSFLAAVTALKNRDVPDDGNIWAMMSPQTWAWLMTIREFTSQDWVGMELPYKDSNGNGMRAKYWLGVWWIEHTGLNIASNVRTNLIWHYRAVGHGIGKEIDTTVSWENTRSSWFINSRMSMGSVVVDPTGVQKLTLDESVALPTS